MVYMTISASSAEVYEYAMKAVFVVIQFLLTFNSEFKYIFCNPKMSPLYYSLCLKKGIYICILNKWNRSTWVRSSKLHAWSWYHLVLSFHQYSNYCKIKDAEQWILKQYHSSVKVVKCADTWFTTLKLWCFTIRVEVFYAVLSAS